LEDNVPRAARWWNERVEEFLRWQDEQTDLGQLTRAHRRLDLRRWRTMCYRAQTTPPASPGGVTAEQVRAVKECGIWRASTLKPILCGLRQFLRWAKNEIADRPSLWHLPGGEEDRRVWATEDQLAALLAASTGRIRVRVVLQGYCGLRECGVRSLRVRDLRLDLPGPTLNVREKGRHGGTWRSVPVPPTARAVLLDWIAGKGPDDLLYRIGHAQADADLATLGRAVGLPFRLSGHVLRRSYGRFAYHAEVPLERIRRVYGHHSVEQTLHYIGVEAEAQARDAEQFDRHMAAFCAKTRIPSEA
jgi:site-specific recombinase XerC